MEAYEKIEIEKLKLKRKFLKADIWACGKCNNKLKDKSVICDNCLIWYDYQCVNYQGENEFVCYKCI